MRELTGFIAIVLFWLKVADFIREFPFELKLPSLIVMGAITLVIAYFSKLTSHISCRKLP